MCSIATIRLHTALEGNHTVGIIHIQRLQHMWSIGSFRAFLEHGLHVILSLHAAPNTL